VLFQETAQDLTLFSFLKENCQTTWRTYQSAKSAANTERDKYFYNSVSKSFRCQENCFLNLILQKLILKVGSPQLSQQQS
jgi:hypothetical protein